MEAELQTQIAFHLSGKKPAAQPAGAEATDARPALLARYRDLTALRYDFPLVLLRDANDNGYVQCLSAIVDNVANAIAKGEDGDRLTRHLLRLEREIRVILSGGAKGQLSALWDDAAKRLTTHADDALKDSLKRGRAALKLEGEVTDCDRTMPARLLKQAWTVAQERKARKLDADLGRLIIKLSDILTVDLAHSAAGRSAASLKAAIGDAHAEVFDFNALSRMLGKASTRDNPPVGRRRRIESLLSVLKTQRFFAKPGNGNDPAPPDGPYSFVFDSCTAALAAYRERLPKAMELAKAISVAKLEVKGEYSEARHDAFFKDFGDLGQEELSHFPDYMISMSADKLHAAESDSFMEMLSAGLPAKVLVQTDDLLQESRTGGDGHFAVGMRAKQLANMAIGLNDVYVLQSASSNLFQFRDRILKGMTYAGPALFSVYSGASDSIGTLPTYLNAAAAMESRAFPAYCYDPSAGPNWASRFYLDANSQPEADWPVQTFTCEDGNHQRVSTEAGFTFVDFIACDRRYGKHFARVPHAKWNANMISADEFLRLEPRSAPDKVPFIAMVDSENNLYRVIVDDRLMRAALRCRESWHSLQELGGIHNSHAERLLAQEKQSWAEREKSEAAARAPAAQPAPPAAIDGVAPATPAVAAEPEEKKSPDEAYIETPRCTTCNECTQINDKMFAYNEDKQAYIANPDAGTYAQLVEAAESCQVSIIHPGKPRNPAEPGLAELLKRAELFA